MRWKGGPQVRRLEGRRIKIDSREGVKSRAQALSMWSGAQRRCPLRDPFLPLAIRPAPAFYHGKEGGRREGRDAPFVELRT